MQPSKNLKLALLGSLLLSLALCAPSLPSGDQPLHVHAQVNQSAPGPLAGYRYVDHLVYTDPEIGPGQIGDAADISSAPDGTLYLLDRRQDAIHVYDSRGFARSRWLNPDAEDDAAWRWQRIDVGFDGRAHLLARGVIEGDSPQERDVRYRVVVLSSSGEVEARHELSAVTPERYVDLGIRDDGRIYLSRTNGNVASRGDITYAIDILAPDGALSETLIPEGFYIPLNLDLDAEGRLYLSDQFPHTSQLPPEGVIDGVAIFNPDHSLREKIQMSGVMDIAAAGDGVAYVSRNREILRLGEELPFHIGPPIQKNPYALTPLGRPEMFSLDLGASGALGASMTHCSFQGWASFDAEVLNEREVGETLAPRFIGGFAAQEARGLVLPLRSAVSKDPGLRGEGRLEVLQARYALDPESTEGRPLFASTLYTEEPQTLLHYTRSRGYPLVEARGQTGACGVWNAPASVLDLAVDGHDLYSIDFQSLKRRELAAPTWRGLRPSADAPEPERTFALEIIDDLLATPHLLAISANEGRAAILDTGSRSVVVVDRDIEPLYNWAYDEANTGFTPVDVALARDRVVLAASDGRVAGFNIDGSPIPEWSFEAPASLRAIDLELHSQGSLLGLTPEGWVMRFGKGGRVEAAFALPEDAMDVQPSNARDIAVDDRGWLYIPYGEVEALKDEAPDTAERYRSEAYSAGVLVFKPDHGFGPGPEPISTIHDKNGGVCRVAATVVSEPPALLGEPTPVELLLDGICPASRTPTRLVVVIDSSKTMNNDNALDRAKQATISLLGMVDPEVVELALISANSREGAQTLAGFGDSRDDMRTAVAGLIAIGDNAVDDGLDSALEALRSAREDGNGQAGGVAESVLVVTDGAPDENVDRTGAVIAAIEAEGASVFVQLHPYFSMRQAQQTAFLARYEGATIFDHHAHGQLEAQIEAMVPQSLPAAEAPFESIFIQVELPDGMQYVEGSAGLQAQYDPDAGTLRWDVTSAGLGLDNPFRIGYSLVPQRLGSGQAVHQGANAVVSDAQDQGHVLEFPALWLDVEGEGRVYMPSEPVY